MIHLRIVVLWAAAGSILAACDRDQPAAAAPAPAAQATEAAQPAADPPPAAAAPGAKIEPAAPGKPAPDFTLTDTEGKTHRLSELRGKTVVLEWFNPDCPFVRFAHSQGPLKDMAAQRAGAGLVWLAVNSGAPGKQGHGATRNRRARSEYTIPNPVLLDESGDVGRAYGATKTPHMFVIDDEGVLVFRGGIDNAPMGEVDSARPRPPGVAEDQSVNYVDAALEDIGKGGAVRLSDVPAYGCSVKYAS